MTDFDFDAEGRDDKIRMDIERDALTELQNDLADEAERERIDFYRVWADWGWDD